MRSNPNTHTPRDYGAKNLLVLEGLEAVRKRPAMYIGSTDTRGLEPGRVATAFHHVLANRLEPVVASPELIRAATAAIIP